MNHPGEFTKTTPNHIVKWVLKERQHASSPYQLHVPLPSDVPLLQSSSEFFLGFSCASPPSLLHAAFVATFVQPTFLDAPRGSYPAEIARCLTTARNHIKAVESSPNHVRSHY